MQPRVWQEARLNTPPVAVCEIRGKVHTRQRAKTSTIEHGEACVPQMHQMCFSFGWQEATKRERRRGTTRQVEEVNNECSTCRMFKPQYPVTNTRTHTQAQAHTHTHTCKFRLRHTNEATHRSTIAESEGAVRGSPRKNASRRLSGLPRC